MGMKIAVLSGSLIGVGMSVATGAQKYHEPTALAPAALIAGAGLALALFEVLRD